MVVLTKNAVDVFNPVDASGQPRRIEPYDAQVWGSEIETLQTALANNGATIAKDTLANLNSDLAHDADTIGIVYADGVNSNNGYYRKLGASGAGSWAFMFALEQAQYEIATNTGGTNNITATLVNYVANGGLVVLPILNTNTGDMTVDFGDGAVPILSSTGGNINIGELVSGSMVLGIKGSSSFRILSATSMEYAYATNTGGTDDITATISGYVADGGLVVLPILNENTGDMTVDFGDGAVPILTASGNQVSAGGLTDGMWVLGVKNASDFRLLSDIASAAIQAAAELAASEAEAAADAAVGAMTTVIDPQFSTISTAEAYSPVVAPDYIRTAGYTTAGDGGGALYKKVASEPSHEGKFSITLDDAVTVVWYEFSKDINHVKDFGARGDGVTDDSLAFSNAQSYGNDYNINNGDYLFTDDYTNVSIFGNTSNSSLISVIDSDAFIRDMDSRIIGVKYNHKLESSYTGSYPRNVPATAITTGGITAPPLSKATFGSKVDIIAHFYGDWGLDWYRQQTGISSPPFDNWYTGAWNWDTNSTETSEHGIYDPSRESVLGWYRNDDINVLDWQCYWLRESGVKVVCPVAFNLTPSTFFNDTDRDFWIHELLESKNAQGMSYIPWVQTTDYTDPNGPVTATEAELVTQWQNILYQLTGTYTNNYVLNYGGKRWFTVYAWSTEKLRQSLDSGSSSVNTEAFLEARAGDVILEGYDGIAILSHDAIDNSIMLTRDMLSKNVLHLSSPYAGPTDSDTGSSTTYEDIVDSYDPPKFERIISVTTSLELVNPLPDNSEYAYPGSTPSLFEKLLMKAVKHVSSNPRLPSVVTVSNVSEWAEQGAGLHPNKQDGWGYLNAVSNALNSCVSSDGGVVKSSIPLSNGWVNFGTFEESAQAAKTSNGMVYLSGVIKGGTTTSGTIIGTLPKGYRPEFIEIFSVGVNGSSLATVSIDTNGEISALGDNVNSTFTSLSGISFFGSS